MEKARYWVAVLYPESMIAQWYDKIDDILQIPYAYAIHDMDKCSDNDDRKVHLHLILAFNNTTTYKSALSLFQKLQPNCAICKKVQNIRYMYDYLIHDTDSCRKSGKYIYPKESRQVGNNFDIGSYEQISLEKKRKMCMEVCDFIVNNNICNFVDFYLEFQKHFDVEYMELLCSYGSLFEKLTKGNYLNLYGKKEQ